MSESFVTVAGFQSAVEAQLACARLQEEGIEAFLTGDIAADTFGGFSGLGGSLQLQVAQGQVGRAQEILSALATGQSLDEDWEGQAESAVWVCSLCGEPVPLEQGTCPSCRTPRQAVTTPPAAPARTRAANPL